MDMDASKHRLKVVLLQQRKQVQYFSKGLGINVEVREVETTKYKEKYCLLEITCLDKQS